LIIDIMDVDITDEAVFINDENRPFTMSLFTQDTVFICDSAVRPEIT